MSRVRGTHFAIYLSNASLNQPEEPAMKFETLMLKSLFVACMIICLTTLGAMLA